MSYRPTVTLPFSSLRFTRESVHPRARVSSVLKRDFCFGQLLIAKCYLLSWRSRATCPACPGAAVGRSHGSRCDLSRLPRLSRGAKPWITLRHCPGCPGGAVGQSRGCRRFPASLTCNRQPRRPVTRDTRAPEGAAYGSPARKRWESRAKEASPVGATHFPIHQISRLRQHAYNNRECHSHILTP